MRSILFCSGVVLLLGTGLARAQNQDKQGLEFFEKKIRPVLIAQCYSCHSAEAQAKKNLKGGLLLDTREGLRKGGDGGPALVPGKPKESLLMEALRHEGLKMPPKAKLSDAVIADFEAWIRMGAPDPRDGSPLVSKRTVDIEAGKKFWSFRPLLNAPPPEVRQAAKVRTPVDRFLLAKLEEKGLSLQDPVSKEKLLRRVTFDLIGLPPTPEEIAAFVNDRSDNAYEKVVDRLLESERHGERWARHWFDVVRFAESGGYEFDKDRPGAHHYRDWVIRALNADLPHDEFVRLQIAGDHLKPGDMQAIAATGFLVAGPYPGQTTAKTQEPIRYDHLDDMLSTMGSSMLGLTIGCVRCHEHKYDPIPQQDYYHLLACLARTDSADVKINLDDPGYAKAKSDFDRVHAPLVAARDRFEKEELPGRLEKWLAARKEKPAQKNEADLWTALQKPAKQRNAKEHATVLKLFRQVDPEVNRIYQAVEDSAKKEPKPRQATVFAATSGRGGDVHYLIRGETDRKNGIARPGFIQVLSSSAEGPARWLAGPTKGSTVDPRVALARWLTDPEQGAGHLLARVMVNRLWLHHFGQGIVRTPNDFGSQGDPPTHPELLDWLASDLIRGGWKLKRLHRLLVLSAAYQQKGELNESAKRVDPGNLLWWRMPPRRLEAESIRDAVLAVSGTLDPTMFGPGSLDENINRRSVYLTVKRSKLIPLLQTFDTPEPIQSIGQRQTTTGAAQALALLNSPFVRLRAEKLAKRVLPSSPEKLPEAIERAYLLTLGRLPTDVERSRAARFVQASQAGMGASALEAALADWCQVLLCSSEFVYVD